MKKTIAAFLAALMLFCAACAEMPVYENLENTKPLKRGSKGAAAKELQQLLIDLGWEIDADGIIGSKTFAALCEAQAAYGLDETEESVTADDAALLIRALRVHLFGPEARDEAGSAFDELYVRDYLRSGRNEAAYEYAAETENAELMELCLVAPPESGEIFRGEDFRTPESIFVVRVSDVPEDRLTVVRLTCGNAEAAAILVKGANEARVYLPAGEYDVRISAGEMWFGEKDLLGAGAAVYLMDEPLSVEKGREYTLTVNAPEGSEGVAGYTRAE